MDESLLRREICRAARDLWTRGLLIADGGLISAEVHRRRFLVTPPGLRRAALSENDLWMVDLGGMPFGGGEPLPEALWRAHRIVYHIEVERQAGDDESMRDYPIRAAVLATPPMTLALLRLRGAAERLNLTTIDLPIVPLVEEPLLRKALATHDGIALATPDAPPSVLAIGTTVGDAVNQLERLEHAAAIELACRGRA